MASCVRSVSLRAKIYHYAICVAFEQYKVIPNLQGYRILKNEAKIPWSLYVGLAGMPGLFVPRQSAHRVPILTPLSCYREDFVLWLE